MLIVEAFHTEVGSWTGIVGDIWEVNYVYFFDGMVPQPLPGEIIVDSIKCLVEEELQPFMKQLKK